MQGGDAVDSDQDDPGAAFYHALGRLQLRFGELEGALLDGDAGAVAEAATGALGLWLNASAALLRFEAQGNRGDDQVPPLAPQLVSARNALSALLVRSQRELSEPVAQETIVALRIGLDCADVGPWAVPRG
jgi:hypothetical protein